MKQIKNFGKHQISIRTTHVQYCFLCLLSFTESVVCHLKGVCSHIFFAYSSKISPPLCNSLLCPKALSKLNLIQIVFFLGLRMMHA